MSNNSPVNVYVDDVKITHTPTNVIQYNACPTKLQRRRGYYPFGLQTSNSWTRENSSNNFLYNAGTELNGTAGIYETMFRGYDPALGRFLQVDPLASMYASHTPYKYGLNNPVNFNDPSGANEISINNYVDIDNIASGGGAMLRSGYNRKPRWNETHEDADRYRRGEMSLGEYVDKYSSWTWNPYGGNEIDRETWLALGGDPNKSADHYYSGGWEVAGNGDPNIQSLVNPLSFNLNNIFGRYVTYVDYNETFSIVGDLSKLKVFDQLNLKLNKIALSVRADSRDDPKVLSKIASAFDQARFRLYSDFEERSVFNMMSDGEGEALFMKYLNQGLQIYFPSSTETFARSKPILWVGDIPNSTITFIGPFYSPN